MLEPKMLDAEIRRARSVVVTARERVDQDVRVYGKAHVSKLNRSRWEAATRYLTHLLSSPVSV